MCNFPVWNLIRQMFIWLLLILIQIKHLDVMYNPKLLKYCSTSLAEPIFHLFKLSLNAEYKIPDEWKVHKITLVPKKGNLYDNTNYRPISLLCIISKVLESIVFEKVFNFVCPLLSKHQYGFVKGRSTHCQLLAAFIRF